MKKDTISVIIPAYNAEKYLYQCVTSVTSSTIDNVEIIVVNDGSTDNTQRIAEALSKENENIIVIHTVNQGVSCARNVGLEHATGEYIAFLDADDMLFPNSLEVLLSKIKHYHADVADGKAITFTADNEIFDTQNVQTDEVILWSNHDALLNSLDDHPATYSIWGKLYRRSCLEDIHFLEGCRVHEDSLFLFELFIKNTKMVLTNTDVYKYRITPGSASRDEFSDKFLDILLVCDKKIQLIKQHHPQLESKTNTVIIKANMALLHNLCKTYSRKYKKIQKQCLRTVRRLRRYFVKATNFDGIFFSIIVCRLFFVYKFLWFWRRRISH